MKIAVTRRLPERREEALKLHYESVKVHEEDRVASETELVSLLEDVDAAICTVADRINDESLAKAGRLKCLFTFSVGVDHIDFRALKKRGIRLTNTPNVLTDATADLAFALILSVARNLKLASDSLLRGEFIGFSPEGFLGRDLKSCTLGIIGMGRIGQAVASRAKPFGLKVVSLNHRIEQPDSLPKERFFSECDLVSIHCSSNPSTHHLVGEKELALMKKDAILINTARGPIVDEAALVRHLKKNPFFRVGLDVYEREPALEPGLVGLPNALLLPHIGSATREARHAMASVCVEEAIRFAEGKDLRYEYQHD